MNKGFVTSVVVASVGLVALGALAGCTSDASSPAEPSSTSEASAELREMGIATLASDDRSVVSLLDESAAPVGRVQFLRDGATTRAELVIAGAHVAAAWSTTEIELTADDGHARLARTSSSDEWAGEGAAVLDAHRAQLAVIGQAGLMVGVPMPWADELRRAGGHVSPLSCHTSESWGFSAWSACRSAQSNATHECPGGSAGGCNSTGSSSSCGAVYCTCSVTVCERPVSIELQQ